jgi:hypothetical protein
MRLKYDLDIGVPPPPQAVADKPWPAGEVERIVALVDQP